MHSLPERPRPSRPLATAARGWVQWFGLARLLAIAVSVAGVGAGAFWLLRAPSPPIESSLPFASTSTTSTSTSPTGRADPSAAPSADTPPDPSPADAVVTTTLAASASVVVHVTGAVAVPGVYSLDVSARVLQAVDAAGGLAADADVDALNLAAPLRDGERLFVPRLGQPVPTVVTPAGGAPPNAAADGAPAAGGAAPSPGAPLDLNEATPEQLDALPGIGPATAAAIVAHREQNGPYASVDDLLDVRGIGPAKLDAIRQLVSA